MVPYTGFTAHPEDLRWGLLASSIADVLVRNSPIVVYHSFQPDRLPGVDVAMLDHGNGDEVQFFFDAQHGCLVKGFDHESDMSPHAQDEFRTWPGVLDDAPPELLAHLDGPDFRKDETTFCIWRRKGDRHWWQGEVVESEKGEWSAHLFRVHTFLDAEAYFDWASDYHELTESALEPLKKIFGSCEVDTATALALNPNAELERARGELAKMGVTLT